MSLTSAQGVVVVYLKKALSKKTGRTYLSIAEGYWDKERGHTRTKTVESLGYLDELMEKHDDPVSHFTNAVNEMNRKAELEAAEYTIIARKNQTLEKDATNRKNYGYIIIMKLLYELGLDRFLLNRQRRNSKIECNTSTVMKMLVISRILSPGSKKRDHEGRGRYFDFENEGAFHLSDVYRSLSHFAKLEKDIQLLIHERISKAYGRNLDLIYYDVTNYYFEIDMEDELRRKGVSKEHRPNPIVQLGLAMDAEGLPISYEIFAGNESEKLHLRPTVMDIHNKYSSGRVIAVADSAQNTGNNVYYLDASKQGYIFSQSIRGGSTAFKKYVADEVGYEWCGEEYKRKSRIERRSITVDFDRKDGTTYKKKVLVDQRQIVFYSEKYATRSRTLREAALLKAKRIIDDPSAYTKATSYGALKYIMNVEVDKETGEIKAAPKSTPCFDIDVIREEERYDGYYAIVTNVFNEGKDKGKFSDGQIIDLYRGLWRIEDAFSVTKDELKTRPIFLSREERIKAHFLICYIALVIVRLIQKRTGYMYSPEKLIEAMNNISCSHEGGNLYLFNYRSDVSDALGAAFGLDFTSLRLTRAEIKKNIGAAKKS
jgi:transposase